MNVKNDQKIRNGCGNNKFQGKRRWIFKMTQQNNCLNIHSSTSCGLHASFFLFSKEGSDALCVLSFGWL